MTIKQYKDIYSKKTFNCSWKILITKHSEFLKPLHLDEMLEEYANIREQALLKDLLK